MNLVRFLPWAERYLSQMAADKNSTGPGNIPFAHEFRISALAQGEYNMNYLVENTTGTCWVLRVNLGSQLHRDDQILYEYRTLQSLAGSGYTPQPLFVDDSREFLPYGVLGMEYLPGHRLQYEDHSANAAHLFAHLHEFSMQADHEHLIPEQQPLSMTFAECSDLLPVYFNSPLADENIRSYLSDVLYWADSARQDEAYFLSDPIECIINTEVNSSNFIINPETGLTYLVDWEKALWGDPSQDISHFCVPTTTLWKTDCQMDQAAKKHFIQMYSANLNNLHLRDTIHERVHLRDPFNCLRGISWSAMAWVRYQNGEAAIQNADTWQKLCRYMDIEFIRSLFDPFLKGHE